MQLCPQRETGTDCPVPQRNKSTTASLWSDFFIYSKLEVKHEEIMQNEDKKKKILKISSNENTMLAELQ